MIRKMYILGACGILAAALAACASSSTPTEDPATVAARTMEIILTEISDQIRQSQTMAPTPIPTHTPTATITDTATVIPTVDLNEETPPAGITPIGSPTGPTPTTDPNSLLTRTLVGKCISAFFVGDIGEIQDNTEVKANSTFVKIWDVRNSGFCTWDRRFRLTFKYGQHMGGPDYINFPEIVPPNRNTWLSVTLTAPKSTGVHTGQWYMYDADGKRFGVGPDGIEPLIVKIKVVL